MHFSSRGQARPLEVIFTLSRLSTRLSTFTLLVSSAAPPNLLAHESPWSAAAPATQAIADSTAPARNSEQIAVPTGTRVPLLLRNGLNTRTAKAGDSVYFETAYPIAQNTRTVIPNGCVCAGENPGFQAAGSHARSRAGIVFVASVFSV